MWKEFSNIPINIDDEILEDFYHWQKWTHRFDIWHWFDEKLPIGISKCIKP